MGSTALTNRALLRLTKLLQHQLILEKWNGKVNNVEQWAKVGNEQGAFNCRHTRVSVNRFQAAAVGQDWNSEVLVVVPTPIDLADRNVRYRLTVTEFEGDRERVDRNPETDAQAKSTQVLELVTAERLQDQALNDCFWLLRCKNGVA